MAKVNKFRWEAANETLVADAQTIVGAGSLVLNLNPATGNVSFGDASRTVSLTSGLLDDNSAVNVTINGTYQNKPQTDEIFGPGANLTVKTTLLFDTVTSITFDASIAGMSAGSGNTGRTHWFAFNYNSSVCSFSVQVSVEAGTDVDYDFVSTLCDVFDPVDLSEGLLTKGIIIPNADSPNAFTLIMNGAIDSELAFLTYPYRYACIGVNNATTDGAFTAYFLQQGTI